METTESARFPLGIGGLEYRHEDGVFPVGTDSVLLSYFARPGKGARVCDLGCGGGVLMLLLSARTAGLSLTGIESDPRAAALARKNIEENGLSSAASVVEGDVRSARELFPPGQFAAAVSNPPYFRPGTGKPAGSPSGRAARSEQNGDLADFCAAAAHLLKFGGRFFTVYRPERLPALFDALQKTRLEPKRLRFVSNRAGEPPILLLLEAKKGGAPGLTVESGLVLRLRSGKYTAEARRIYNLD